MMRLSLKTLQHRHDGVAGLAFSFVDGRLVLPGSIRARAQTIPLVLLGQLTTFIWFLHNTYGPENRGKRAAV